MKPNLIFLFLILFLITAHSAQAIAVLPADIKLVHGQESEFLVHNNLEKKVRYSVKSSECIEVKPSKFSLGRGKTKHIKVLSKCNSHANISVSEETSSTLENSVIINVVTTRATEGSKESRHKTKQKERNVQTNAAEQTLLWIVAAATSIASILMMRNQQKTEKKKKIKQKICKKFINCLKKQNKDIKHD